MILPTIKGDKINIRRLKRSDAESIRKYANDSKVAEFLPFLPHPFTIDDSRKWINTTHRDARKDSAYHFGIEHSDTGEIIGIIGIKNLNWSDFNTEVEYWIGSCHWGQGIASEAVRLILRFAFESTKIVRTYAIVHSKNIGSIKVLEKSGFTLEGTWRKASYHNEEFNDVYGYGILKEEFLR